MQCLDFFSKPLCNIQLLQINKHLKKFRVYQAIFLWLTFLVLLNNWMDEVEHDIMNYQNRGLCYLPRPRHEVLIIHDIMRKPNSIIVLLYIFHIIHPLKQKRSVQPFCFWGEHSKGLNNQADVELDMINAISSADIAFIMSSSQAIVNWLNALDQTDFS